MVLKRKRNLKIDANSIYSVFLLKDLDPDELEDYVENRDTGMEADEEKEIHLQNIIKGSGSSIPLPVIIEVNNVGRGFYKKVDLTRKIECERDCENEYIESKEDFSKQGDKENDLSGVNQINEANMPSQVDMSFLSIVPKLPEDKPTDEKVDSDINGAAAFNQEYYDIKNTRPTPNNQLLVTNKLESANLNSCTSPNQLASQMTSPPAKPSQIKPDHTTLHLLKKAGENKAFLNGKNEEISNFCLRRVLLRYERSGYESYTCFRDRIFHPTFKSRRNESLMIEKISRMGVEFSTLKQLCQLYKEKCIKDLMLMKKTVEIVKKAASLKFNRKQKKSVSRMLFEGLFKNAQGRPRLNIHMLMTDREKIQNLKSFKSSSELFLDIKYYDNVMGLVKYKKVERFEK